MYPRYSCTVENTHKIHILLIGITLIIVNRQNKAYKDDIDLDNISISTGALKNKGNFDSPSDNDNNNDDNDNRSEDDRH